MNELIEMEDIRRRKINFEIVLFGLVIYFTNENISKRLKSMQQNQETRDLRNSTY